jgi:hypothetical protein
MVRVLFERNLFAEDVLSPSRRQPIWRRHPERLGGLKTSMTTLNRRLNRQFA